MTQQTFLKTSVGQMRIKDMTLELPGGGLFIINRSFGYMSYRGRAFETFKEALKHPALTAQDLEVIEALAVALCDQSKLLKQLDVFK